MASNGKIQRREHVYEGVLTTLERRYRDTGSEFFKEKIEEYMEMNVCSKCGGKRLKPEVLAEVLAVTVGGMNIADLSELSVADLIDFIDKLVLSEKDTMIGRHILKEIRARLSFLMDVGQIISLISDRKRVSTAEK